VGNYLHPTDLENEQIHEGTLKTKARFPTEAGSKKQDAGSGAAGVWIPYGIDCPVPKRM